MYVCMYTSQRQNDSHHYNDKNEWIQNLNHEYKESIFILKAYGNSEREKPHTVQLGKFESANPARGNAGCVQE